MDPVKFRVAIPAADPPDNAIRILTQFAYYGRVTGPMAVPWPPWAAGLVVPPGFMPLAHAMRFSWTFPFHGFDLS
jgi:hypothetical protein